MEIKKGKMPEVMPAMADTPTELVAQGAAIIRLENETQMQIAIQRPRSEEDILQACLAELDLYEDLAEEAIYVKPVGKGEGGRMKYAEGLSIRAAESLANRWRNSGYACDIIAQDSESVTIAAVFLDYETNTRHVLQRKVSRSYTNKKKEVVQYSPDRFDMAVAGAFSKLLREVVLRSLPAGLKKAYEKKARSLLKRESLATRRKNMLAKFEELGITKKTIEAQLAKPITKFTHGEITEWGGIYNAIKDGEMTVEEVFTKTISKPQSKGVEKEKVEKKETVQPKWNISDAEKGALLDISVEAGVTVERVEMIVAEEYNCTLNELTKDQYDKLMEMLNTMASVRKSKKGLV